MKNESFFHKPKMQDQMKEWKYRSSYHAGIKGNRSQIDKYFPEADKEQKKKKEKKRRERNKEIKT